MNYRQASHKRILFGLILTTFFVILHAPILYMFRQLVFTIGQPLWHINASIWGIQAEAENQSVLFMRVQALESENAKLQSERGYVKNPGEHLANIISSITSSPYDTFIIDQGSDAGVEVGDTVTSSEGVALGQVVESYAQVSKVELYGAYGYDMEVKLSDSTHVLAHGTGSQNFLIKLPRGVLVKDYDVVMIPGSRVLILGVVEYIEENPGDAFQKIYVRSPLNILNISRVYVSK